MPRWPAAPRRSAQDRPPGAGYRADLIRIDDRHPILAGRRGEGLLDALVFSGNVNLVRDVMVGGTWVVRDGRHLKSDEIAEAYRAVVRG